LIEFLSFYSTCSPMTYLPDEPEINTLLKELPDSVPEIVKIVQNTLLHIFWAERYGEKVSEERSKEVNLRSAADILRRAHELNPEKLVAKRKLSEKVIGNCRDFTVLSVALMRKKEIPARARCGFGAYFSSPDMKIQYMDHWVVEYWNKNRWVMVDSQLDDFQSDTLKIDFDPLDVPHDRFITGGAAWRMCRKDGANPDTFGINEMSGLGFIMGDMIRDLAALDKVPLLPWDCWGLMLEDWRSELELLDAVSEVTQPGTEMYDEMALLSRHPKLTVPNTIVSWMGGTEPIKIKLENVTERML
jgi:Transglutaminase-like superfamily